MVEVVRAAARAAGYGGGAEGASSRVGSLEDGRPVWLPSDARADARREAFFADPRIFRLWACDPAAFSRVARKAGATAPDLLPCELEALERVTGQPLSALLRRPNPKFAAVLARPVEAQRRIRAATRRHARRTPPATTPRRTTRTKTPT